MVLEVFVCVSVCVYVICLCVCMWEQYVLVGFNAVLHEQMNHGGFKQLWLYDRIPSGNLGEKKRQRKKRKQGERCLPNSILYIKRITGTCVSVF